eukprot:gene2663-2702_t
MKPLENTSNTIRLALPGYAPPMVSAKSGISKSSAVPYPPSTANLAASAVVQIAPPLGPNLQLLGTSTFVRRIAAIAAGGTVKRVEFFTSDPTGSLRSAPHAPKFTDPTFVHYDAAPLHAYLTDTAVLLGQDGVVLVDQKIVPDTISHLMPWRPGSEIAETGGAGGLALKRPQIIRQSTLYSETLIGFSPSWSNYAHWMQECLPKLFAFLQLSRDRPGLRIILPRLTPGSFQAECLSLLGVPASSVLFIEAGEAVAFRNCWLVSGSDIWSIPPVLRDIVALLSNAAHDVVSVSKRIYLHRAGTVRSVSNFEALLPMLVHHGFEVVTFDNEPLSRQIAIMQAANCVIAEHGAGLANIQFCRPGTAVLELFNEACVQPAFWSLASCFDLRFGFLVGRSVTTPEHPRLDWNSSYEIDPQRLDQAIRDMHKTGATSGKDSNA